MLTFEMKDVAGDKIQVTDDPVGVMIVVRENEAILSRRKRQFGVLLTPEQFREFTICCQRIAAAI